MREMSDYLRDFPFFNSLEEEDLAKIAPLFMIRTYEKGTNVFLEADQGDELYMIESGVVTIYRTNEAREIILAIFREGEFFGEMAVLEDEQIRSASAKAVEKTRLYVLKRNDFVRLMNNNPHITVKIMKTAMGRLRKANELITDLTILDARTRIARGLLRLAETYGIPQTSGTLIDLRLTHQQIADLTGTVRETVTKVMLELQNQQIIHIDKKKISVSSLNKLEQWIGIT